MEWPLATYLGGDIDPPSIEQARIHAAFCKSPVRNISEAVHSEFDAHYFYECNLVDIFNSFDQSGELFSVGFHKSAVEDGLSRYRHDRFAIWPCQSPILF